MPDDREKRAREPVTATVLELMPQAVFRVELEDRRQLLAHLAGASRLNFVRVRPGDKVQMEISPHDPTRGRITKLLKQS